MNTQNRALLFLLATLLCPSWSKPQAQQTVPTISSSINGTWSMIENQFISVADAMPEKSTLSFPLPANLGESAALLSK
jgi:hypothetical protein